MSDLWKRFTNGASVLKKTTQILALICISLFIIGTLVTITDQKSKRNYEYEYIGEPGIPALRMSFNILSAHMEEEPISMFKIQWEMELPIMAKSWPNTTQMEEESWPNTTQTLDLYLNWGYTNCFDSFEEATQYQLASAPPPPLPWHRVIETWPPLDWPPVDWPPGKDIGPYPLFTQFSTFCFTPCTISYAASGIPFEDYPFDEYKIYFQLKGLRTVNLTKDSSIYLRRKCSDLNWDISKFDNTYNATEGSLDVVVGVHRVARVKWIELFLPLFIFLAITIITPFNYPLTPLNEGKMSQKFRMDSAKWILAFAVGSHLLAEGLRISTLKEWISMIALILSALFYLTSRYQGQAEEKGGAIINVIVALFTTGIFIVLFCVIFFL